MAQPEELEREVMQHMSQDERKQPTDADACELTPEEIAAQEAAELPDREAMSLINANIAIPINAAVAANVLSDGAAAYAEAIQTDQVTQGN
jgi:hypothetical protein